MKGHEEVHDVDISEACIALIIALGAACIARGVWFWVPHDLLRFGCYLVLAFRQLAEGFASRNRPARCPSCSSSCSPVCQSWVIGDPDHPIHVRSRSELLAREGAAARGPTRVQHREHSDCHHRRASRISCALYSWRRVAGSSPHCLGGGCVLLANMFSWPS